MIRIEQNIPLVEEILGHWKETLGPDYAAYRNHVYRVIHFCLALQEWKIIDKDKYIIAACFHDLGIWTKNTLDYLDPSVELTKAYLIKNNQEEWLSEIKLMIIYHHKITRYRNTKYPKVEIFRKADWIDVTKGKRSFGLMKKEIKEILDIFPNNGFHKMLFRRTKAEFKGNPFKPLPMMKW